MVVERAENTATRIVGETSMRGDLNCKWNSDELMSLCLYNYVEMNPKITYNYNALTKRKRRGGGGARGGRKKARKGKEIFPRFSWL